MVRIDRKWAPGDAAGPGAERRAGGIGAYYRAFDQWADPASQQTLTELTRQALGQLRAATAALS